MTVPLSEAVARRVPVGLRLRREMGDLWACMTLATVRERVENRRTSPDCDGNWEGAGVGCVDNGVAGDGTGEG